MIFVDKRKNTMIDVPSNLPVLPRKFFLTDEDLYLPGETSFAQIAEMVAGGDDTYREFYDWMKVVMAKLMMEDITTHTLRTARGKTIYAGVGPNRQPVTKVQSRWLMPTYQKSITEGAIDAPEDYWFKWLDEAFYAVMPFIETIPTTASDSEPLSQAVIDKRLNKKNPKRVKALGWIKELVEEHGDTFSFLPKTKSKAKATTKETA